MEEEKELKLLKNSSQLTTVSNDVIIVPR